MASACEDDNFASWNGLLLKQGNVIQFQMESEDIVFIRVGSRTPPPPPCPLLKQLTG